MPDCSHLIAEAGDFYGDLQPSVEIEHAAAIESTIERLSQVLPDGVTEHGSCYYCSEEILVTDVSKLERGQHITVPGHKIDSWTHTIRNIIPTFSFAYKHHFITTAVVKTNGHIVHLEKIQVDNKNPPVTKDTVLYDLKKDYIWIVKYKGVQRSNEEVAQAAEGQLAVNAKSRYHLFGSNCEHFATSCVLGTEHSLQVDDYLSRAARVANNLHVPGGDLASNFVAKIVSEFLDEFALGITASRCVAGIFLGATALLTLLYSIGKTMYYKGLYAKSKMCACCYRKKVMEVWLCFAVFALTSAASFYIQNIALPLIAGLGNGFTVVVILLSLYTQWEMPKIVRAMFSPFDIVGKQPEGLKDIHPGDVVSFYYWFFKHYGIVTGITKSGLKCIHYATDHPLATRTIVEKQFVLSRDQIKKYDCSHLTTWSPVETVRRARLRKKETKWGPLVNRSDHMCYWAKVAGIKPPDENAHRSLPAIMMTGTSPIHLADEIDVGDHVFLPNTDGIICKKDDSTEQRRFQLWLVCCESGKKCRIRKFLVRLSVEWVKVQHYHPAHCRTKKERAAEATRLVGETHHRQRFLEITICKQT